MADGGRRDRCRGIPGKIMSGSEPARVRLEAAIATLEREVDAKVASVRQDAAGRVAELETELAALRTDKDQLAKALKNSETQARDLREVAQTTGARIDHTLAGIKEILAGDGHG